MPSVGLAASRNSSCANLTPAPGWAHSPAWPILLPELLPPLLLLLPELLPPCPVLCQHIPGIMGQFLVSLKLSKAVLWWSWAGVC